MNDSRESRRVSGVHNAGLLLIHRDLDGAVPECCSRRSNLVALARVGMCCQDAMGMVGQENAEGPLPIKSSGVELFLPAHQQSSPNLQLPGHRTWRATDVREILFVEFASLNAKDDRGIHHLRSRGAEHHPHSGP